MGSHSGRRRGRGYWMADYLGWEGNALQLIWGLFVLLIIISIVAGVLSYTAGRSVSWLAALWAGWGLLWIFFTLFFVFYRGRCLWRGWGRYYWRDHWDEDAALHRLRMHLVDGDITLAEYRRILRELKRRSRA